MLPLIISDMAEDDLNVVQDWYERKRTGLAEVFRHCVEEAFDQIRLFPQSGATIFKDGRKISIRRFPYRVLYRIEHDCIRVLAIFHNQRDQSEWKSRI